MSEKDVLDKYLHAKQDEHRTACELCPCAEVSACAVSDKESRKAQHDRHERYDRCGGHDIRIQRRQSDTDSECVKRLVGLERINGNPEKPKEESAAERMIRNRTRRLF